MLLFEIEKKESKTTFQKLIKWISQSPQYNQSRQSQSSRGNVYEETAAKNKTYLKMLVPYLNNPSEETIFRSNKIKEQRESMKLQNNEVILRNT